MEGDGTLFKILRHVCLGGLRKTMENLFPVYEVCVGGSTAQSMVTVTADQTGQRREREKERES
jgi:hypothetical protein